MGLMQETDFRGLTKMALALIIVVATIVIVTLQIMGIVKIPPEQAAPAGVFIGYLVNEAKQIIADAFKSAASESGIASTTNSRTG